MSPLVDKETMQSDLLPITELVKRTEEYYKNITTSNQNVNITYE